MPLCRPRVSILVLAIALGSGTGTASSRPAQGTRQSRSDESAREKWQRVGDVFAALNIGAGGVVADLGAGGGFFTVRLAEAVGDRGRVYAVDVSEQVVRNLSRRVESQGLQNVEVIQGVPADPRLPQGALDAVLIVNAYHEMREHQQMLAGIRQALKPGGRLVLVEPTAKDRPGVSRDEQVRLHIIAIELAEQDLKDANFQILEQREGFVDRPNDEAEWLIVARAP